MGGAVDVDMEGGVVCGEGGDCGECLRAAALPIFLGAIYIYIREITELVY